MVVKKFAKHAEAVNWLVDNGYEREPGNDYWSNPKAQTYWAQVIPAEGGGYNVKLF